jgi:pimeloyl-ACP methyl ester carboxylesterase
MDGLKIEKAHLVGHHTGALIGAAVAARYPKRVIRLVLNGCVVPDPKQAKKFYKAQLSEPPIGPLEIKRDGSHVIRMWKWQLRENPESSNLGVLYATIANWEHYYKQGGDIFNRYFGYDLNQDLPKIRAKTLVLMGTKEQFNPNQPLFLDPAKTAKLIPGVTFKIVEGAGILFWYDMPRVGANIVINWLRYGRYVD